MRRRVSMAVAVVIVLSAGCSDDGSEAARTYYKSLDLESPEAAVETFVEAFRTDDFMTVWLVLHPEAQFRFQQHLNLLEYGMLVDEERLDVPPLFDVQTMESNDGWWVFDQLMLAADRNDALLFDLGENVALGEGVPGPDGTTDVPAEVDGIDAVVTLRIGERAGRYRVLQVIVPGGAEEVMPWSVPARGG